jgi:uncharacterized protein (DUF1697 family)
MSAKKRPIERRVGLDAIPKDIESRMTKLQRDTLTKLRVVGWSVQFVRRPLYEDQVIVLVDSSGEQQAVLQEDGSIIRNLGISVR